MRVDCKKLPDVSIQVTALNGGHDKPDDSELYISVLSEGKIQLGLNLTREQFADLVQQGLDILQVHNSPLNK